MIVLQSAHEEVHVVVGNFNLHCVLLNVWHVYVWSACASHFCSVFLSVFCTYQSPCCFLGKFSSVLHVNMNG